MTGLVAHEIGNGSLRARITNFGASLTDLRIAGTDHPLVLGFPDLADQAADQQFMGAVIGRYANRIARGHVPWGASALTLEKNENGTAHLHGGTAGFAGAIWSIKARDDQMIVLGLDSPDGEAGYPGNLTALAKYEITQDATLRLTLSASTDQDTVLNLCHHPYFNLDGSKDIGKHKLWIAGDHYLPADTALIPTGTIAKVSGTPFDFSKRSKLRDIRYNNTYCLHRNQIGDLAHAATLQAGMIEMELHTTQPGLHLYDGYKIRPKAVGHHGSTYTARAGVCLEAQAWPDSPNHAGFPDVILRAGEKTEQITEYRFRTIAG